MTSIRLDPTAGTTAESPPPRTRVLTVDPGTSVTVRSLDASGCLWPQEHPGQAQNQSWGGAPSPVTGPSDQRSTTSSSGTQRGRPR
jgi:hypothetical protein